MYHRSQKLRDVAPCGRRSMLKQSTRSASFINIIFESAEAGSRRLEVYHMSVIAGTEQ